jgi:hypothetical protein
VRYRKTEVKTTLKGWERGIDLADLLPAPWDIYSQVLALEAKPLQYTPQRIRMADPTEKSVPMETGQITAKDENAIDSTAEKTKSQEELQVSNLDDLPSASPDSMVLVRKYFYHRQLR